MLKQLKAILWLGFFWMLLFFVARAIFLLYYAHTIAHAGIPFTDSLEVFYHALKLDLATACYFLAFPLLFITLEGIFASKFWNKLRSVYVLLMLIIYTLTAAGELGLYEEWKTKLTYKALLYLENPSEVYNSSSTATFIVLLLITIAMVSLLFWGYQRFFNIRLKAQKKWGFSLLFFFVLPPFMVVGMRGGLQQIPINQSQSYFSSYEILNHAAVNNVFNLYISYFENREFLNKNPYDFFKDPKEAEERVQKLFDTKNDSTISILNNPKPNIVLIILESWSADLIESLGGEPGITPVFHELEKEGILFSEIYASGSRSEQGMAAIFSGFPAHAYTSVTVQPDKFPKLPSLVHELKDLGYFSSFYFGGQLIYGNIKSYMMFNGFHRIREIYDFDQSLPQGKLGVHDEYTLATMAHELNADPQPFFSSLFTLSSHSPYDQPMEQVLVWGGNEKQYINSAYYTDRSLGRFFEQARKTEWYQNTLFVLVADHSHNSYRNWSPFSAEYHHIPLLFYGDVIKKEYRGSVDTITASQTDIAATLLAQLGDTAKVFPYSRNLFNPDTKPFAYWELASASGIGWKTPSSTIIYDHRYHTYVQDEGPKSIQDSVKRDAYAFLQHIFKEYLDL